MTHESLASDETRGASADSGNPRHCVAMITQIPNVTRLERRKAESGGSNRLVLARRLFSSPPAMTSAALSPFADASTDQRLILLPQESAALAVDQVQPGAGLACDGFILGFRRVLVVVQPVLNLQPGRRTGENRSRHSPRTQRSEMLVVRFHSTGPIKRLPAFCSWHEGSSLNVPRQGQRRHAGKNRNSRSGETISARQRPAAGIR